MPNTNPSINMSLPIPAVGLETGPQWASDLNSCLLNIDSHDHSAGHGVQITPAGININSLLSMNSNDLTQARSIRLLQNSGVITLPADVSCIYSAPNGGSGIYDLFFNDGSGAQIALTKNGGVAGTPGSIANLTSPASASYVAANSTFVWQSAAATPGNLDAGFIILRNNSANSKGLKISPPLAMGVDYSITLPNLPASTLAVTIDASGNMGTGQLTVAQLATLVQQALNPSGTILAYGGSSAPAGYLPCYGTAVSRTTYAALFAAIGTNFGNGDGSTTFNIPDLRGQFLRGADSVSTPANRDPDYASRTAMASGGNTGSGVGSIQDSMFASHNHSLQNKATQPDPVDRGLVASGGTSYTANQTMGATGGNETRPINAYVNYIIKT